MRWRRSVAPVTEAPVTGWKIVTEFAEGKQFILDAYLYGTDDEADHLRFVDAIADGLRERGYPVEVTIERKATESR